MEYKIIRHSDDSLMHYGVMGMKWGVRKSPNYIYRSHGTKKYQRKVDRLSNRVNLSKRSQNKLNKYSERLRRSKDLDKRMLTYSKQVSAGKNIATRIITGGSIGGKRYQVALSALGGDKSSSLGKKWLASIIGSASPYALTRAIYIRDKDK